MANKRTPPSYPPTVRGSFGRGRDIGGDQSGDYPADIVARENGLKPRVRRDLSKALIDPHTGERILPSRTVVISPPEEFPIPSAQFFFENVSSLVLAAGAGNVQAGPSFQLPAGAVGVIRSVNIYVDAPTLLTNVVFEVLINNAVVPGLDKLREFPRVANNISKEFERAARVPNAALISTVIRNLDAAGPWTVGMEIAGWFWPERDGEIYTGLPFGRV